MSMRTLLKGWQFRTRTPRLEPGQEVSVMLTDYDAEAGAAVARIGDTRLVVEGTGADHLDKIVHVRVSEFDDEQHVGRAELTEVVSETTY